MDLQLSTQLWVAKIIFGVKDGCLAAEAIEQLQVHSSLQSSDGEVFFELFDKIVELVIMTRDPIKTR